MFSSINDQKILTKLSAADLHVRSFLLNHETIVDLNTITQEKESKFIILTAGGWSYRIVVMNWIRSMESLGIDSYVVMCYDQRLLNYIGPKHGILIRNRANFKYTTQGKVEGAIEGKRSRHASTGSWFTDLAAFNVMMLAKYDAIYHILSQLHMTVVWSDADCILLKSCALDYLLSAPSHVDIVGQRGTSPKILSDLTGACLCTGFFMVRPSVRSVSLMNAMRMTLLRRLAAGKQTEEDQTMMNELLYTLNGFFDRRINYTENSRAVDYTNSTIRSYRNITLGLLPYPLFPRGVATSPHLEVGKKYSISAPNIDPSSMRRSMAIRPQSARDRNRRQQRRNRFYQRTSRDFASSTSTSTSTHASSRGDSNDSVHLPIQAAEWQRLKKHACVWHRLSKKTGRSKLETMITDGVLLVNSSWWREEEAEGGVGRGSGGTASVAAALGVNVYVPTTEEVRVFLYGRGTRDRSKANSTLNI
jgi:hypothetical protein